MMAYLIKIVFGSVKARSAYYMLTHVQYGNENANLRIRRTPYRSRMPSFLQMEPVYASK